MRQARAVTDAAPRGTSRPYGSVLLGRGSEDGHRVTVRVRRLLAAVSVVANLVGATVVWVLSVWVLPGRESLAGSPLAVTLSLVAVPVYVGVAVIAGVVAVQRRLRRRLRWLTEDRRPGPAEQRAVRQAPLMLVGVQGGLWALAATVFTIAYGLHDADLIARTVFTIALGGAVTCANVWLLSEFALRPVAARAMAAATDAPGDWGGAATRTVVAWALGSAVPVIGLMLVALFALVQGDVPATQLAVTMLALGGTTIGTGFVLTTLAARATVDPIRTMRRALGRVEQGQLDVRLAVYDATEIGQLQVGFNRMVEGLRERERVRDLFGRHVGEDVALAALERGIELGGEVREVAVVFIDVVGSTTLAATRPPTEVVAVLNRFFTLVVEVVAESGGLVNKFQGDAALAIFGAPSPLEDAPGAALRAARTMAQRLRDEVPEFDIGAGVSAGPAVAGNVGAEQRYEYTVIGDPVNAAARLSELAKHVPGRVLADRATVDAADGDERCRWEDDGEVMLRGRPDPTHLAVPAGITRR
jgi:adenylate cyclase